jgi:hypothetical protein
MDNVQTTTPALNTNNNTMFSNKNFIIMALIFLLALSFLGINLLVAAGNFFESVVKVFGPFVNQLLTVFGVTTGTVINTSADVVADTAKLGIDIAEGTVHSIGDLLKGSGTSNVEIHSLKLDNAINKSTIRNHEPAHDTASNPIQKPISSKKTNWCLVGEYQGRRGCIEVGEHDKCLSGQVFPQQKMCLNPTFTPNK